MFDRVRRYSRTLKGILSSWGPGRPNLAHLSWVNCRILIAPRPTLCCITYYHFHYNIPINGANLILYVTFAIDEVATRGLLKG